MVMKLRAKARPVFGATSATEARRRHRQLPGRRQASTSFGAGPGCPHSLLPVRSTAAALTVRSTGPTLKVRWTWAAAAHQQPLLAVKGKVPVTGWPSAEATRQATVYLPAGASAAKGCRTE